MSDRDKHRALRLAAELTEAQRKLEEWHILARLAPVEYLEAIAAVYHQAHNGVMQGDDLGYVRPGAAESRAPKHDPHALDALRSEIASMKTRARALRAKIDPKGEAEVRYSG